MSSSTPSIKRSFVYTLWGILGAQGINFLFIPILGRLYTPEQFGALSIFLASTGILSIVGTLRLDQLVVVPKRREDALHLTFSGIVNSILVGVIVTGLSVVLPEQVYHWLGIGSEFIPGFRFLGISVATFGCVVILTSLQTRFSEFNRLSASRVSQAVGVSGGQAGFAWSNLVNNGLIYGKVIGDMIGLLILLPTLPLKETLKSYTLATYKRVLSRNKLHIVHNGQHAILSSLSSFIPLSLLSAFFTTTLAGFYGVSYRICYLPITVFSRATANTINPRLSELVQKKETTIPLVRKIIYYSLGGGLVFNFFFIVWGPDVFVFVLGGEQWRGAGEITRLLAPWFILSFPVSNLAFLPVLFNKQRKALLLEFSMIISRTLGLLFGVIIDSATVSILSFSLIGGGFLAYYLMWYHSMAKDHERLLKNGLKI